MRLIEVDKLSEPSGCKAGRRFAAAFLLDLMFW